MALVLMFFEKTFPTTGCTKTFDLLLGKLKENGIRISAEQVTEKLLYSKNMSKMSEYLAQLIVALDRQLNEVKDSRDEAPRVFTAKYQENDSSKISRD